MLERRQRALVRRLVILVAGSIACSAFAQDEEAAATHFRNPYFTETKWKVWRDDPSPLTVVSLRHEGNEDKPFEATLEPVAPEKRTFPIVPPTSAGTPYAVFQAGKPTQGAGMWDDVYASWSGLHGYVRPQWKGTDGSQVDVRGQIMDFVDVKHGEMLRAGVNFVHQSTTGMGHAISNGVIPERTRGFEELYFADLLVTAPAHASFTEDHAEYTKDLYIAHVPTLFHSVGSSDSETMAITKLAIVGAYLPEQTKLLLKRNGLYPSALLYLWKAALPYDVPFDHELRHRIAYKAVGDRTTYPGGYGAAGIERGDRSLAFHRYDDLRHMRAMIDLARAMETPPPEALFHEVEVEGGKLHYALRKSAVVLQRQGETAKVTLSTKDSYDLLDRPLDLHWRLLYGNDRTRVTRDATDPQRWHVEVPWNDALPEGRTAIGLFAHAGVSYGNPAILTIYRQKGELPPSGHGPGDYAFPATHANRRPVLLDVQDATCARGRETKITWRAVDPEGFPVAFHLRSGDVGTLDGNEFSWKPSRKEEGSTRTITVIASDETSGNAYAGRTVTLHLDPPEVFAHIDAPHLVGVAPLTLTFSGKHSTGKRLAYGWDVHRPDEKREAPAFDTLLHTKEIEHTFAEPGIHEVTLTVKNAAGEHTQSVRVYVHGKEPDRSKSDRLIVRGGGARVQAAPATACPFDGTDFGRLEDNGETVRRFVLTNASDEDITFGRRSVTVEGPGEKAFRILTLPRHTLAPGDSTFLDLRFRWRTQGVQAATVKIDLGSEAFVFAVTGEVAGG